jgi:plastocyanin
LTRGGVHAAFTAARSAAGSKGGQKFLFNSLHACRRDRHHLRMNEGDTFQQTFKEAGKYDYVCTVHPNMTGTVEVQ